jgi:hypothetical protein
VYSIDAVDCGQRTQKKKKKNGVIRVLALLLATRPTTKSACVGHVTSRPTVSQSEYHRRFLSGLFKILVAVVLRMDFLSMPLIILRVCHFALLG